MHVVRAALSYNNNLNKCHFRIEREWLKYGYHDMKTIDAHYEAGVLSEKMKNALLGVHKRIWPTEPSTKDLQFVNGVYESLHKSN